MLKIIVQALLLVSATVPNVLSGPNTLGGPYITTLPATPPVLYNIPDENLTTSQISGKDNTQNTEPVDGTSYVIQRQNHNRRTVIDNTGPDTNPNVIQDETIIVQTGTTSGTNSTQHLHKDGTTPDGKTVSVEINRETQEDYSSETQTRTKKEKAGNVLKETVNKLSMYKSAERRSEIGDSSTSRNDPDNKKVSTSLVRGFTNTHTVNEEALTPGAAPTKKVTTLIAGTNTIILQKGKMDPEDRRPGPYGFGAFLTPFRNLLGSSWGGDSSSKSKDKKDAEILTLKTNLREEKDTASEDPVHKIKVTEHNYSFFEKVLSWLAPKPSEDEQNKKVEKKEEPKVIPTLGLPSNCKTLGGTCYYETTTFTEPARLVPGARCSEHYLCYKLT